VSENTDVFKTFIVRFIGNQEYSFYNVEDPDDGLKNLDFEYDIRDLAYASITESDQLSASPNSVGTQPQSTRSLSNKVSLSQEEHPKNASFVISRGGEFDTKLQEQACKLQQSINESNVIGNEFNR